jgi:hypothetical protein
VVDGRAEAEGEGSGSGGDAEGYLGFACVSGVFVVFG